MKDKKIFFIFILFFIIICVFFFKIKNLKQKNTYHRNRMIELSYLIKIVNESDIKLKYFKEKWKDNLLKQNIKDNIYVLNADIVLSEYFFENQKYSADGSDFYGYQFEFDTSDNLISFNLYKP